MTKITLALCAVLLGVVHPAFAEEAKMFYDFTVKDIAGNDFSMAQLAGKKVMIVNVASKCGNTPQYKNLEALYKEYTGEGELAEKKFVILGFPANNFGQQEPGTDEEIKSFCTSKYDVTFPMMSKVSTKGDDIAPIYAWLTRKEQNGVLDAPVTWNFQKFLIDETGKLVASVPPGEKPDSGRVVEWLEGKPWKAE